MPFIVELIEELQRRQAVYPVHDSEFEDVYFAQASDSPVRVAGPPFRG